ncbi:hypothetical protein JZU51_01355, partial [bacterium]|nr:hypothetical protein [bacterium]
MLSLPKNVRIGRNGRIGILKKIPRDLWQHPRYIDKAKVIERSTGSSNEEDGVRIAMSMLSMLESEFAQARAELEKQSPDERQDEESHGPVSATLVSHAKVPMSGKSSADKGNSVRQRSQVGEETRRDIIDAAM